MSLIHAKPHDPQILEFVKVRVDTDIELEIVKLSQKVRREIESEIKKARSSPRK